MKIDFMIDNIFNFDTFHKAIIKLLYMFFSSLYVLVWNLHIDADTNYPDNNSTLVQCRDYGVVTWV